MSKVPQRNNWLKASDINGEAVVTILTEAVWEEGNFKDPKTDKPQQQYVCKVNYNGDERKLKLTMKSCDNISPAYGLDSKEWIGKQILLKIKEMEVGGKDVKSIRAFPILKPAEEPKKVEGWDD